MKNVEMSQVAAKHIESLRNPVSGEYELTKDNIVNSMASISDLINAGRDEEVISVWIDELLKVLYTLGEYNELVNELYFNTDNEHGKYTFHENKKED